MAAAATFERRDEPRRAVRARQSCAPDASGAGIDSGARMASLQTGWAGQFDVRLPSSGICVSRRFPARAPEQGQNLPATHGDVEAARPRRDSIVPA
jgi:hypothetical protein